MAKKKTIVPEQKKVVQDQKKIVPDPKRSVLEPKKDISSIINASVNSENKVSSKVPQKNPVVAIKKAPEKIIIKMPPKPQEVQKPAKIVVKKPVVKETIPVMKRNVPEEKFDLENKNLEVPLEHEAYFVYLKNPLEYRRYLLECSRKVLFCLRSHQKLLLIRQKKLEEMENLKTCIKELMYMNKKFNERLPRYNMTFFEDGQEEKQKGKIKTGPLPKIEPSVMAARKPVEPKREKSELEKLEDSLASIENKLKGLQ